MRTVIPKNAKLLPKEAKLVFKGMIFDTYQWEQELFDGSFHTFEMLKRVDTTKVIAIKDDRIVILEEQQPGGPVFFDVPGGRHDFPDETELQAAQREMLEETGMTFSNWRLVEVTQPHNKIEWFVYTFLATDFQGQTKTSHEAGEKINIKTMTLDEAKLLVTNPKTRWVPEPIMKVGSLGELANYPEFLG